MYEPPHWTKPRLARIARKPDEASEQKAREALAQDGIMVVGSEAADMIADLQKQLADMREGMRVMAMQVEKLTYHLAQSKERPNPLAYMRYEQARRDWALAIVNGTIPEPVSVQFHIDGRQDRN